MRHLNLNNTISLIFLFTLVFNQQVNITSMSQVMTPNQNVVTIHETVSNKITTASSTTITISHLKNDNIAECHSKTCYEICQQSIEIAMSTSLKIHINPNYISSMLNVDYNFNYNEVKLNELYRPPQYVFV